ATLFNIPVWMHLFNIINNLDGVKLGFIISLPVFLISALNFVFTPFSFRYIFKPFFCILFICSSIVTYATMKYGVQFDKTMMQNIFETNAGEMTSYFNMSVVLWFLFTGILPCGLLLLVNIRYPETWIKGITYRLISMFASLLIIFAIAFFFYKDYASVGRNNSSLNKEIIPTNYIYSGFKYVRDFFVSPGEFRQTGTDASRTINEKQKPVIMFLVVGETARSQNYALNGYSRGTNDFTKKYNELISFHNVQSCGTSTAISVPCMFSDMKRKEFNSRKAVNSENVLDILYRTGVNLLWIENDGGCKGVCKRIPTINIEPSNSDNTLCKKNSCYDEVMLKNIDEYINNNSEDKLIVFHLMGSHGPTYYLRYPESHKYFKPTCDRSDIENCTHEQLINTYDNTIRYTDYIISKLIDKLIEYKDEYDTVLLYVSDHGESLGENGLYLHGTPYNVAPAEQTHVPLITWMSPGFVSSKKIDLNCLSEHALNRTVSHDNIFSSLLGLWNVN
ncbi:TPA: phosphoethanolamine transferase, partial [Escherichia coli]|nr:phosphoethanolamine transferase [Escherichia coli]